MSRSRSGSRPSSRPASRPVSMISSALALSPLTMELGEQLITKITSFEEGEENFDICRAFMVSNLLYHSCLDPHERDLERRFDGIREKWIISADGTKADRMGKLLTRFNNAPVFAEPHEQGDIRVRLLSLLLHLSNSNTGTSKDDEFAEDISFAQLRQEEKDIRQVEKEKAAEIRKFLAEGEETNWNPHSSSDLSDWSVSDDDACDDDRKSKVAESDDKALRPVFLPGCSTPLKPPIPVSLIPGKFIDCDVTRAKDWLRENVLPQYWVKEIDGRNKFPLMVTSNNENAHLLKKLEDYHRERGIPVDVTVKVSEYQVLRECLWTLRCPTCESTPLFTYDRSKSAFVANKDICIPSLSPESLSNYLSPICEAMSSLHRLTSFISRVFDRRQDDSVNNVRDDNSPLPPCTFEAYAEGLTDLLQLFSADLLQIEDTVQKGTKTFTLMDLKRDLHTWFLLLNHLAVFHKTYVDDQTRLTYNWQKSFVLISSLNASLNTAYKPEDFSIFVDLFLKTIAPYFRIISTWVSHGRLEDWRNEFVFAANPKFGGKRVKRKLNEDDTLMMEETFWFDGFIVHPYEEALAKLSLEVPEMFVRTLPRILTCGKSIEILTRLEKEGVLLPVGSTLQDLRPTTQFNDNFLANLKGTLVKISTDNADASVSENVEQEDKTGTIKPGEILGRFVHNVEDFDPYLVAAFEAILDDETCSRTQPSSEPIRSLSDILNVREDFMILHGYFLDPMIPISNKLEGALTPVVHDHTEHACKRLLHLFSHTLELEEHITTLRRVYLLEAGDLLQEFYTEVFARFDCLEISQNTNSGPLSQQRSDFDLDSLTLTLFLHDCLSRRSEENDFIYRFKVDLDNNLLDQQQNKRFGDIIDCLTIKYTVDWPITIVLHASVFAKYNKIFVFLLKVKMALWNLQRIQAKDLIAAVAATPTSNHESDESESDENSSDLHVGEHLSNETKIHRILLLRSWLFHFVNTIHSHFMTRVIHSTELELRADLSDCSDLDAIISAHDRYVEKIFDRCFLHPTATILRESVLKVLHICSELYHHCSKYINDRLSPDSDDDDCGSEKKTDVESQPKKKSDDLIPVDRLTSLEEDYARSHQFLASTLNSMTKKRNVPHLNGLAASLLHSCPSVTVLEQNEDVPRFSTI